MFENTIEARTPARLIAQCDAITCAEHVERETVELAYLDPPFTVGTRFLARTRKGQARSKGDVAYDDMWPSLDVYLAWLGERVRVVHSLLSARGTMWLHLDHRAVHDMKRVCDEVFGRARFVAEIIWVPGNGSKARSGPGITHQTLLVYARGDAPIWNGSHALLREPYAKTSQEMHFKKKDAQGRRYRDRTIGGRTYRYYADVGRAIGSVWADCPAMVANTPLREEATGYPTQKPLKLLERIVVASSTEGGLVIDPFCGSGTTLVAAAKHGRSFFGCDVGTLAIDVASRRLEAEGVKVTVRR